MKPILGLFTVALALIWVFAFPQKQANKPVMVGLDKQFASEATVINMAEVQLGTIAQENATSDFIKQFAAMMVKDHSGALSELKSIASDKGMTLPTALDMKHQAVYNKLSGLNGASFDSAYKQAMIEGHMAAAKRFLSFSAKGKDAELRTYASKHLPAIQRHLQILRQGHM